MKKGLTYIDIAMSVGIFVIYSLFLFIVLEPGVEGEFDEDYLPSIIRDGLTKDIYTNITILPIFIDYNPTQGAPLASGTGGGVPSPGEPGGPFQIQMDFSFNWQTDNEHILLLEDSSVTESEIVEDFEGIKLHFDISLLDDEEINRFILLRSYETFTGYNNPTNTILQATQYEPQIGIAEVLTGISESKLSTLETYDYSNMKQQWYYPKSREFQLNIYDPSDLSTPIFTYGEEPTDDVEKIYVLQWTDHLLNIDPTLTPVLNNDPVVINIKTW